jgi:hypothetical protein
MLICTPHITQFLEIKEKLAQAMEAVGYVHCQLWSVLDGEGKTHSIEALCYSKMQGLC